MPAATVRDAHRHGTLPEAEPVHTAQAATHEHYVPLSVASAMPPHTRRSGTQIQAPAIPAHEQHTPLQHTGTDAAPEQTADRSTEDRVHAWYRSTTAIAAVDAKPSTNAPVVDAAETTVLGSAVPVAALPKSAPASPAPKGAKATTPSVDQGRPQPQQVEIVRTPPAAAKDAHTTADDDAAFAAASNIPSTAPTAREPLPFVHGDFPGAAHVAAAAPKPVTPPVVRIDPRGDAEVLAAANTAAPHKLKDVVATPKPVTVLPSATPAVSASTAAAKRPKLDPALGNTLAAESLDDDAALSAAQGARTSRGDTTRPAGYDLAMTGSPAVNVNLYDGAGQLILLPPMKGSHEILVHQNQMAVSDGLDRVENDAQLAEMRRLKLLVALPDTDAIYPNDVLPLNRRYARPWVVRFLNDLAQAHYQRFHTPLIVTSAVRTVAFQRHLVLVNGNAAPPTGDVASPHLYGQAIDIAKKGMSVTEIAWMRSYLTPVEAAGKIDVEEEFQQSCFHMSVYRRYAGLPEPNRVPEPPAARTLQLARTQQPAPSMHPLQRAKAALSRHRRLPTALLATGLR